MERLIITESASAAGCLKQAKVADKVLVTWPHLLVGPLPSDAETVQIFDPDFASDLAISRRAFPQMWHRPVWRTRGRQESPPELGLKDVCRLFDTIELWFDPVAESQLALVHLLDYLKRDADLADRMVLIHLDRRLGECTPEAAVGLRPPRTSVDGRTVAMASRIWSAWRQPTPLDFARGPAPSPRLHPAQPAPITLAMSDAAPLKRLHIKTFGCQMNVYDSERMADVLAPMGYVSSASAEDADLVILNTCHIREKAAEKVYSDLGRLKVLRAEREAAGSGRMTIAVAGCVAQAEGAEIMRRQPAVDLVVGPQSYQSLPDLIARMGSGDRIAAEFAADAKFDALPKARAVSGPAAFLTVQEGCDKFCTFCVVPYTRGSEYSRPVAAVVAEAERLADQGVREVTLLGQNVNAYDGPGPDGSPWSLARLIRRLAEIPGLSRIRYTTSHPRDMGEDLIVAHGEVEALMPYLHLPVQTGSDRVLKAMNRAHTAQSYLDLVARIRAVRPDIALSGDFIVGFPGETETDFQATLDLVEAVGYAGAFSFKYSRRPGTPAAAMAGQVDEEAKAERLARLQAVLERQQAAFNQATVGRTLPVLFERTGRNPGQIVGRSPYLQGVWAEGPADLIGQIADVQIAGCGSNSLSGTLVAKPVFEAADLDAAALEFAVLEFAVLEEN